MSITFAFRAIRPRTARSNTATWFEGARLIVGDGSAPIENAAFLVEGETFAWVGKQGQRQPPSGATRVDLTGKTVMPALIDGHNHIGLVNEKDGSNSKANYTRENLVDQLQRYAYYGVAATLSMGLEADQDLAYDLRDQLIPNAARFLTVGKGIAGTPIAGPPGEPRLGIPYGARNGDRGTRSRARAARARRALREDLGRRSQWRPSRSCSRASIAPSSPRRTPTAWKCWRISAARRRWPMPRICFKPASTASFTSSAIATWTRSISRW